MPSFGKLAHVLLAAFAFNACGEGQNFNKTFVSQGQREATDYLRFLAQAAYDRADHLKAKEYALKAYEINPASEETAILLGYIHMSLAGIDTFQLTRNMIEMNDTDVTKEPSSKTASTAAAETASSCSTKSGDAATLLSSLSCVIGMDQEELEALVADGNKITITDGSEVSGESTSAIFADYPLKIPKKASEARHSLSQTLTNIDAAITYICPFVDPEVKIEGEIRHAAAACPPSTQGLRLSSKAHFLWSIAHVTEALAFNSIVLYTPPGASAPSLLLRGTALNSNKTLQLTEFITALAEFSKVVDVIMPVEASDTMLNAMFNDLDATLKGFSKLGLPASIVKSFETAISGLKDSTSKVNEAKSQSAKNSSALKTQLTTTVAKQLDKKISDFSSTATIDAAQKTEICAAYKSITGGTATACPS